MRHIWVSRYVVKPDPVRWRKADVGLRLLFRTPTLKPEAFRERTFGSSNLDFMIALQLNNVMETHDLEALRIAQ